MSHSQHSAQARIIGMHPMACNKLLGNSGPLKIWGPVPSPWRVELSGRLSRKLDALKELPAKVQRIEIELNTMNDIIQDLGSTNLNNNVIKGWIGNVRKLSYRIEDVIDKYSYEALKLKDEGFLHRYIITGSRHVKVFSKIAEEVEEIHAKIDKQRSGSCFPELFSDEDIVGIDENRSKLIEWLATKDKESTVITVSGMGGLGKTTLVKNVYDREKVNFPDAHAWIVVSKEYDVIDLLGTLLTKIQHTQESTTPPPLSVGAKSDVYDLTEAINNILQDKKCLIVLDDVWNKDAYNQMCNAFQGIHGSRVMITTRMEDVAALAQPKRRLVLQPLGSTESFKLFCSRAFHNNLNRECPLELKTVATKVVERCRGLPLAIVSSGVLLSTKQPTEHAWNHMFNHLHSELRGDNHVQPILDLSYHDLPGDLRNVRNNHDVYVAVAGFAVKKENSTPEEVAEGNLMELIGRNMLEVVERDELLRVSTWFAVKKENSTPEEVAEGNLMELIGRNMLEVVERDELLRVSTCKMHDLVRDLALAVAKEERFGSANGPKEMIRMDKEVRRFSTCGWTDSKAIVGVKFPRLRTIMSLATASPCTNMLSSVLSGSSYLTVLELQDSAITQVPASIGDLFNLRYIGLRRTNIQSLPHTIDKLSNLETLDIKQTKVEKLPPGIVNIEKLRHLLADRFADEKQTEFRYFVGVEAPHMISNFQELQTLETIHASKDLSLQLQKMMKLQTVWVDNINASNCDDLLKTLSDMPLLSSLLLSACDENETLSFQALKPVSTNLHINASSAQYFRAMGRVSRCFPKLKTLVLKRMPNVKQLEIKKGAIPAIDGIYIVSLSKLNMVPHGIESLETLKKLWMLDLHKDFKAQWNLNQMHNKMKDVPELRV
uniref:Disease resistance protein RPM1 n=1 Tax=Aegilops tauschii TaxID=37682 RepID=M8CMA5_AEGTA